MKTVEEQIAEHEAKPFVLGKHGMLESKCTAIVDENGAIIKVMITSPYPSLYKDFPIKIVE